MNDERIPLSLEYVNAVEDAKRFMFRMQFVEYHPEPLSYEEIQAVDARLLRLSSGKVHREIINARINLQEFKVVYADLIDDRFATEEWASVKESVYWNKEQIIRRLKDEGRSDHYIEFTISQLYILQQTIMERICAIREIISMFERPASVPKQTATTTEPANENMTCDDVEEFQWVIHDDNILPFSPWKKIAADGLLSALQGFFHLDMSVEDLLWCVRRAQYGEMLRSAKKCNRAGDFKRAVNEIIKGYFPNNDDYLKAAYKSMGIESDNKYLLSQYKASKGGKDMLKRLQNVVKS